MASIGVLALQGDFEKHGQAIERLGHTPVPVKKGDDLKGCDRLIMPGGESTAILKLIERLDMRTVLSDFIGSHPVFGTCAGLIMLAREADRLPAPPFAAIDIRVRRNAYGRQIDSFVDTVTIDLDGQERKMEAVFIRAPKIVALGPGVTVLGRHGKDIVLVREKHVMAASFHPELTADGFLHDYFINKL